jgi:hypothetical protein
MPTSIKTGINCLIVAGLTVVGFFAFVSLPQFTLEPLLWADRHFDRPATMAFLFVYTVLTWAVLGAVIAWCTLLLRPRKVALYGLASAIAFIVTSQSWTLHGSTFGYVRELVFVLTVPLLYWLFVRLSGKRPNLRQSIG